MVNIDNSSDFMMHQSQQKFYPSVGGDMTTAVCVVG